MLFVCLGNICRSPTAEGVMRELVRRERLEGLVELDSAGTGAWHVGNPPDPRATAAARARGFVLEGAARKVEPRDFEYFDLILAMDRTNLEDLRGLAPDAETRAKVRLLREFDSTSNSGGEDLDVSGPCDLDVSGPCDLDVPHPCDLDVPDPYYGGPNGFEEVLDLVQAACAGLLAEIRGATTGTTGVGPPTPSAP